MNADEARIQREQLARWTKWATEEGTAELPVHLGTYMRPDQVQRIEWLVRQAVAPVLEVGCSWGYVLAHLDPNGVGIDINPRLVELSRILSPEATFETANATTLPFGDGTFKTVVLAEVLEHLPWESVPEAISEAKRVGGGYVLATVPNPSYEASHAESFKHRWLLTPEKQIAMNAMLGPGVPVGPFLCYRAPA
jgi:2-polyprenyl-3-methyl-5-hydroxy-6-metoxy-1,4-benzoquinol methylase